MLQSLENGKLVYKRGNLPLIGYSYNKVIEYERFFETVTTEIEHCLPFGSYYASLFQWFIQSGAKSKKEILDDSTYICNYTNNDKYHVKDDVPELLPVVCNENWNIPNIYDLAGNTV